MLGAVLMMLDVSGCRCFVNPIKMGILNPTLKFAAHFAALRCAAQCTHLAVRRTCMVRTPC